MVNLTFNAIDVETANRNRASICQIGIAQVRAGEIHETLSILVNPEEPFESINTSIHGIEADSVRDANTLPGIYSWLHKLIEGTTLVSHTAFDRQALEKAISKYGLPAPGVRWLDSAKIASHAWPEKYRRGGRSLKKIGADLGIKFQHHDAGEDSRVAAEILLRAYQYTGIDVDGWLEQAGYKRTRTSRKVDEQSRETTSRNETSIEKSQPQLPTSPIGPLANVLELEKAKGLNDTGVVGGMDRFIHRWANAITEELGDSGIHRILITIPYNSMTREERSWYVDQWQRLIARPKRDSTTASSEIFPQPPPAVTYLRPPGDLTVDAPVNRLRGVDETLAGKLNRLQVFTVRDLLHLFPKRHLDYSNVVKISDLVPGETCTVVGRVSEARNLKRGPDGPKGTEAVISDDTGNIRVGWPWQGSLVRTLKADSRVAIWGEARAHGNTMYFLSHTHELPDQDGTLLHTGRLVPVYPVTRGISNRAFRNIMWQALQEWLGGIEESLPNEVLYKTGLHPVQEAINNIHYPDNLNSWENARRRLVFDEAFTLQLAALSRKRHRNTGLEGIPIPLNREVLGDFLGSLPFSLTVAQRRCIREILEDLKRGTPPMNRLLQGEVGSGKTVVAIAAALATAAASFQTTITAPTAALAKQHFETISRLLGNLTKPGDQDFLVTVQPEFLGRQVSVGLLTGNTRSAARRELIQMATEGTLDILVGTQPIIQSGVSMPRLALAVADEQQRPGALQLGVSNNQRKWIPHTLTILAAQLPRTLSLTVYGDQDISNLDDLPAGRLEIATRWVPPEKRQAAYGLMRSQIQDGRQGIIICPLAEESATIRSRAATQEHEQLSKRVFPDLRVGLLHGKMTAKARNNQLDQFQEGEIDILVSTPTVMRGIDTTNSSIVIIEDADTFKLAEIDKLRGRVGRNEHKGYCLLISDPPSETARVRLTALEQIHDGFRLAEVDLELSGIEDMFGTQQIGLSMPRMFKPSDFDLLELAREEAHFLLGQDPNLTAPEHVTLAKRVQRLASTRAIDENS